MQPVLQHLLEAELLVAVDYGLDGAGGLGAAAAGGGGVLGHLAEGAAELVDAGGVEEADVDGGVVAGVAVDVLLVCRVLGATRVWLCIAAWAYAPATEGPEGSSGTLSRSSSCAGSAMRGRSSDQNYGGK